MSVELTPKEWSDIVRVLRLSPGQAKVVELILRGQKDKEIARQLKLRHSTVRTYLNRAFQRLGVTDRVGLVLCVMGVYVRALRPSGDPLR